MPMHAKIATGRARGAAQGAAMGSPLSEHRALWLSQHVLPHEPALRAWLARHVRNLADVDDVVQETYAVLMTLERVGHIENPRSYLFTTAKSLVLQGIRRAKVVPIDSVGEIERLPVEEDAPTPESHAASVQELRHLEACIGQLPAKCREAFLLRKVQGMPQREIAAHMGVSENTVEKHIVKALKYLSVALMARGAAERHAAAGRRAGKEAHREEWN